MYKPFFIVGAPRSRTAWFSAFFTTDKTFCFHELSVLMGVEDYSQAFESMQPIHYEYIGNSDPFGLYELEDIVRCFPDSPIVAIYKPSHKVVESLQRWWKPGLGNNSNIFSDSFKRTAEKLRTVADGNDNIIVEDFYSLKLDRIWHHCIPNIPHDYDRAELMDGFKIEVDYYDSRTLNNYIASKRLIFEERTGLKLKDTFKDRRDKTSQKVLGGM